MYRTLTRSIIVLAGLASLPGCYTPSGGLVPGTGGADTYYSTETMQKSVSIVDLRTGEVIHVFDIPPGKQLTVDFEVGEGDDPVQRPDLMRYEIMELGTKSGKLGNAMSVPAAASRRLDVTVRQAVDYPERRADRSLRTDELADRPDWWTPRGGPMPENEKFRTYDN